MTLVSASLGFSEATSFQGLLLPSPRFLFSNSQARGFVSTSPAVMIYLFANAVVGSADPVNH